MEGLTCSIGRAGRDCQDYSQEKKLFLIFLRLCTRIKRYSGKSDRYASHSFLDEQGDQWFIADLGTPVSMVLGVKFGAFGQYIRGIEVLAC